VLDPGAVGDGTLDQLDSSILLTPSAYLITAARGSGPAPGPPGTGQRDVAAGHRATWYLATPLDVSRLEMPDPDARQDAAAGTRIGLMTPGGPIRWFPASAASASLLAISPPHPVTSVAVVAGARGPRHLGPPSVADPGGNVVVANGQLQDALTPPQWGYEAMTARSRSSPTTSPAARSASRLSLGDQRRARRCGRWARRPY
jgi:hypothetical protein